MYLVILWFDQLWETWLGNNVSWLVHLWETWLGNNAVFETKKFVMGIICCPGTLSFSTQR
jgi:hypothetical protein